MISGNYYKLSAMHKPPSDPAGPSFNEETFALKLTGPYTPGATRLENTTQWGVWWSPDEDEAVVNRRIRAMLEKMIPELKGDNNG